MLGRSARLNAKIQTGQCVLNLQNTLRGVRSRRGDSTFGDVVPHSETFKVPGFAVYRGEIATVEIGTEVKILAKAMIKQIDRVISDLVRQVEHFRQAGAIRSVWVLSVSTMRIDIFRMRARRRGLPMGGNISIRSKKRPTRKPA